MHKSKTNMKPHQTKECHAIIHGASAAAAAAGAIPIPVADAIPICAVQITMIISLGKVFGLTIGRSTAESIAGVGLAAAAGRFIFANAVKLIPVAGSIVGAVTAAAITEALGWLVADDFYRISIGEKPEKILKGMADARNIFRKVA